MIATAWAEPQPEKLQKVLAKIEKDHGKNPKVQANHLYWQAYNLTDGWYGAKRSRNTWITDDEGHIVQRIKTRMRRREWMETYVFIRDKATGDLVKFKLNAAQRKLEADIIKLERAGVPIRVIACKARQIGFSTYAEALMLWLALHKAQTSCLLIADTQTRAKELLSKANIARENIPRFDDDHPWEFDMKSEATYSLVWAAPFNSEIQITSSETPNAGRGGTRRIIVEDEKAFWSHAEEVMASVGPSLPKLPNTYKLTISTANGDYGLFRDEFMAAWNDRFLSVDQRIEKLGDCTIAAFFPFYGQPEYRWTAVFNRPSLPKEMADEIQRTLDDEEKFILSQRYFQRGVGWRQVDLDQIAWWRLILNDPTIHGDRGLRRQEFAFSPETCFLSSGRRVFDSEAIQRQVLLASEPVLRGVLEEPLEGTQTTDRWRVVESFHGGLHVWRKPIQGRKYVIGSDAAGGGEKSDFAAAVVVDAETCQVDAIWRVRMSSSPWGEACSRLGWYFNEAVLAFETHPSAFGLAACHSAIQHGYQQIFTRHRETVASLDQTDLLGFHTNVGTKPLLIARIEESLAINSRIPALPLLQELSAQSFDPETGKMVSPGHDDMVMAYGIALYVRDLCWTQGLLRPDEKKATTESDRFWEDQRRRRGLGHSKKHWIA